MKTVPACLTCVLGDVYAAARQVTQDPAVQLRVAKDCMRFLADTFGHERVPSYYITEVHRILKRDTGVAMPFAESRDQLNQVATELAPKIQAQAERLQGLPRFRFLAMWALAGNSLDSRTVGIGYGFEPAQMLQHLQSYVDRGMAKDDVDGLYEWILAKTPVLYIHDNVGEIALDTLFIREIRRHGCHVTSALRGAPDHFRRHDGGRLHGRSGPRRGSASTLNDPATAPTTISAENGKEDVAGDRKTALVANPPVRVA